jgi:SAM-dependent methyltransferase
MITRVSVNWLALREPADAEARATALLEPLGKWLATRRPGAGVTVVYDLGCGSGSMSRWLAARLAGAQHWVMCDHDADLLARAVAEAPGAAADGARVTSETRLGDVTRLGAGDLAGASLITASALLDMFTAEELDRFATACAAAACPVLGTLSVVGRVRLTPEEPFDRIVESAFNDHQRRRVARGSLVGPDAGRTVIAAFRQRGYDVCVQPSPWRLGPDRAELTRQWLDGWVGAAVEQRPELAGEASAYASRRQAQAAAGRLAVTVGHDDFLAAPSIP